MSELSPYMLSTLDGLARHSQHRSTVNANTLKALETRGLVNQNGRGFVWPSAIGRLALSAWTHGIKQGRGERKTLA